MKRYLKYILLSLVAATLAVSCLEELEPTPSLTANDEVAVLVPRVKSFTNQYVTKAGYEDQEQAIHTLNVLIFNNDGELAHTQNVDASTHSFTLNKSMLNNSKHKEKLGNATVVMLANMALSDLKIQKNSAWESINTQNLTLDILKTASYHVPKDKSVLKSIPADGFPMIGGKTEVDLSPTSSTNNGSNPVVVDLKILYAKINFEISVDQDGENQRVNPSDTKQMQFQLSGYSIHNVSEVTSLAIPSNEGEPVRDIFGNIPDQKNIADFDEPTASEQYTSQVTGTLPNQKTATLNGSTIPFTFYMAESRYNHNLEDLTGVYPDDDWLTPAEDEDVKGWTELSEDQRKLPQNQLNGVKYGYDNLIQQYKPKIVEKATSSSPAAGKATYVKLIGTYTDYRGTNWTVNYTVYLGKDNAQNFHIDRNSEYTNYISIKGIRDRQQGTYGEGEVWIDHRVNVSLGSGQGPDNCVTITRETLLDAHIEVRPLRVQWSGTAYDRVNIYLPTGSGGQLLDWIGIEKFTGENCQDGATYCFVLDPITNESYSIGKRKYFTTGLINELQTMGGDLGVKTDEDGRKFLDFYNGDCAWIYFDENTSTSAREAVIRLEFYKNDRMTAAEEYTIRQRGLQTIEGTSYIVESYEEYLHSYDSADKYNLSTSPVDYTQQGLAWGKAEKLSTDIIVSAAPIPGLRGERYDYFHRSDVPSGDSYYTYTKNASGDWNYLDPDDTPNFSTGLYFTDRASTKKSLTVKDMASIPDNAYQYCLSKNKFNETDNSLDIHWYLPDVYELKAVLAASQSDDAAADFGSDSYYWSSQPSYTGQVYQNIAWIDEVPENARAVSSKSAESSDKSRSAQNRIRCFYSEKGISVNMQDRVPDGLGGNYSFLMKGKPDDGYFHNLVLAAATDDTPESIIEDFDKTVWYDYPTWDNSSGVAGAEFNYVEITAEQGGFEVNPQENWKEYILDLGAFGEYPTEHYSTLAKYPGLARETLQKFGRDMLNISIYIPILGNITLLQIAETLGINVDNWFQIEAYKPIEGTVKSQTQIKESSSIKDMTKMPLPETLKPLNDKLTISLGTANSRGNKPDFEYYEVVSKNTTPYTREWVPPVYNKEEFTMDPESSSLSASGTGSTRVTGATSKNQARQRSFTGSDGILGIGAYDGAYKKAQNDALANLNADFNTNYKDKGWTMGSVSYTTLSWESGEPNVKYTEETTSGNLIKTYNVTCTVTLTATAPITKPGSKTLYIQADGTGDWGQAVKGTTEKVSQSVQTDELRVYSGNSITINCTDPAYEITKVRVYFSGSNQISQQGLTTYLARFVDSEITLPQEGDETSHLFGMEYNDADKWQQWSGIGKQSITLNLADYVVTTNFDLGGIFSGNWFTYDYEYRTASRNLDYYLVVDRIEVKCTEIKEPEEESTE